MSESTITDGGSDKENGPTVSPSTAVIEAISEKTGADPGELPPLYEAIDPEALDQLFADRDNGSVTFSCCGHEITVAETGEIIIDSE